MVDIIRPFVPINRGLFPWCKIRVNNRANQIKKELPFSPYLCSLSAYSRSCVSKRLISNTNFSPIDAAARFQDLARGTGRPVDRTSSQIGRRSFLSSGRCPSHICRLLDAPPWHCPSCCRRQADRGKRSTSVAVESQFWLLSPVGLQRICLLVLVDVAVALLWLRVHASDLATLQL